MDDFSFLNRAYYLLTAFIMYENILNVLTQHMRELMIVTSFDICFFNLSATHG